MEDKSACRCRRVDVLGQGPESGTPFTDGFNDIEKVFEGSGQTVVFRDNDDIAFPELTSDDVVRHELVGRIVDAYEVFGATNRRRQERRERKDARREAAAQRESADGAEPQGEDA